MSDNNNTVILIGAAIALYMYSKSRGGYPVGGNMNMQPVPRQNVPGRVQSMPSNVGTGTAQVAAGAVAGFLQYISKQPSNNTPQTTIPSYGDALDPVRSDIEQEYVSDVTAPEDYMIGDGDLSNWGYA